jgi:hypothetical protein
MAATEVIHFPFRVQLSPRLPFRGQILFEPRRPFLPNLALLFRCMLTVSRDLAARFATRLYRMNCKRSTLRGLKCLTELRRVEVASGEKA